MLSGIKDEAIFIDKNMPGGGIWKADLEKHVKECKYFICLIGPSTLDSPNVRDEIRWATDYKKVIIPICHNGCRLRDAATVFEALGNSNGRKIKARPEEVTAREYDEIVQFVVSSVLANISEERR